MPIPQGIPVVQQGTKHRDPALVELTFQRGRQVGSVIKSCLTFLPHRLQPIPPSGSPVPRISQRRKLEWAAISDPGMELASPALAGGFFTTQPPGKPSSVERQTNQQVKYLVMHREKKTGEQVF